MAGNLNIIEEEKIDTKATDTDTSRELLKQYSQPDAAFINHFYQDKLLDIAARGALIEKDPPKGRPRIIKIKCYPKDKNLCEKALEALEKTRKREYIPEKDITIPDDKTRQLADYIRQEEASESAVLYIPDIAEKKLRICARDDLEKVVHQLKLQIGQIKLTTRRGERNFTDSTEDSARDGKYAKPSGGKGGHWRYSGARSSSGSNDEEENVYDDIEAMDESTSPEDQFQLKMDGGFILKVYKASILRLRVDTIVNAANDTMSHGGGVAYVISQAAGRKLDEESYEYVKSRGRVSVTDNIVTTAGKLKNMYKGVIHAVGPMWHHYSDKMECLDDLYDCIGKIFETCDRRRFASVGMPAISSGIFAVPQELCADMYVKAAADYSSMIKKGEHTYPKELHIIDVNERILHLVKESVRKWEKDPKSVDQRRILPKYLDDHPHLKRSGGGWSSDYKFEKGRGFSKRDDGKQSSGGSSYGGGSYRRQQSGEDDTGTSVLDFPITKMPEERFRWGGTAMLYGVGHLKVKIFKGDIVKAANVDAIICGVREGMESSGFIAEALKKEGGQAYQEDFKRKKSKKFKVSKNIMRCKGGSLKVDYVVHVVQKQVRDANEEEVKSYQKTIFKVLKESADHWMFQRIVLPMIGTGLIQSNKSKLQKCCVAILQAFEKYFDNFDHTASLKEVHLVNNNELVCKALTEVFDAAAGSTDTNSRQNRGSNSNGVYDNSNRRNRGSSPVSNNGRGYGDSNRRHGGSSPGSSNDGGLRGDSGSRDSRGGRKTYTKEGRVDNTGYSPNNKGGTDSYPHSSGSRKGRPLPSIPGTGKQNVCDDDSDERLSDNDHYEKMGDVRDARRTRESPKPKEPQNEPTTKGNLNIIEN